MSKKLSAIVLLALFIVGMLPIAFADEESVTDEATEDASVVEDSVTVEDEVSITDTTQDSVVEDATVDAAVSVEDVTVESVENTGNVDETNRIEACVRELKNSKPRLAEANARKLCRARILVKKTDKIRDKSKELKAKSIKIREKVKEFKALEEKKEFKDFKKVRAFKARVVAQEKLHKARMDFAKAKTNFLEAKEKFGRAKLRLHAAKELRKNCEDATSEECAAAKLELKEAAKDHFIKQADIIIDHLQKIKSRAETSESISEERASTIINWADNKIAAFEAIKKELNAAETKEEILEAAKKLRREWKDTKLDARAYIGRIVNARIGGIIVKSKFLEAKLERALERMEENGKDISQVEPLVEDFNAKIAEAQASYEEAMKYFELARESSSNEERVEYINSANAEIKEAKKALIDATRILKEIVKEVRSSGSQELQEASVEVEEEVVSNEAEEEIATNEAE